jgi:hypothetical protein
MTAAALDARQPRALPVPLVLGLQEGRRIVQHPIALVGLTLTVVSVLVIGDNGPRDAFDVLSVGPTFYYGVFVYFAANLVADRDRRAHTRELVTATPSPATDRTAGLCLAALVPTAVCAVFVLGVHVMQAARDLYVVTPGVWHLAQGPLTVLGGAVLGVMVSRWTSVPGAPVLVMLALVASSVAASNSRGLGMLSMQVSWAVYVDDGRQWAGLHPGSPGWHAAYLLALSAMAACGSFLRETARPWRVVGLGAVLTALAVVFAVAQLP